MIKWMRKITIGVITTTMVMSLVACGKSDTETSANSNKIKVLLSEEPGSEDALNNALKKWADEKGITVERIIISHDDQLSKFPAMAKNKDLPDLISTTRLHQLYPDEFKDMSTIVDLSRFEETALKIVGKDYTSDKISGLPSQFTITNFYYNADAFEKAGIEVPTAEEPWTWDELYANAEKLQQEGGVKYGFASDVSRARYDILMYANGGSLVEKSGETFKVTVNSTENVETLERFVKANEDGIMPKAIWSGGSTDNPVEYFKNGDVAILLSGSWNYNPMLNEVKNFEFGVMPSPKGVESQAAIIGGAALAIPEQAKNSELAEDFIKWFYDEVNFKNYIQEDAGLSSLKDVVYEPTNEKAAKDFEILQGEVDYVTDTFMIDESSSWKTYKDNEYRDYIKRAVSGEMTAKQALDAFAKELSEASNWEIAQ